MHFCWDMHVASSVPFQGPWNCFLLSTLLLTFLFLRVFFGGLCEQNNSETWFIAIFAQRNGNCILLHCHVCAWDRCQMKFFCSGEYTATLGFWFAIYATSGTSRKYMLYVQSTYMFRSAISEVCK